MRYTQHQNCTRFTVGLGKADYLKNPNINQSLNLPVSSIGVILSFTNLIEWGKWVKWTHVKVPFSLHACMGCAYYQWFSSVQFGRSVVSDSLPPHGPQHGQASVSITNSQSLLRLMSIESVMPSNRLILSSPSPAFNLSEHQGLFKWVGFLHQLAKIISIITSYKF